jgi:pullulanase/glycogen debranching enzyme
MDNAIFYTLAGDKRYYKDYTGTGNTINANHPVVRDHILAALRYRMVEMHVDGFRFHLASVLGRDSTGKLLANAPLLERIAEDPILRDLKIIAEAWDAAGAYEVGASRNAAGRNGTAGIGMMSGVSGAATMGCSVCLPAASVAVPTSTPSPAKVPTPASISSPATTVSR